MARERQEARVQDQAVQRTQFEVIGQELHTPGLPRDVGNDEGIAALRLSVLSHDRADIADGLANLDDEGETADSRRARAEQARRIRRGQITFRELAPTAVTMHEGAAATLFNGLDRMERLAPGGDFTGWNPANLTPQQYDALRSAHAWNESAYAEPGYDLAFARLADREREQGDTVMEGYYRTLSTVAERGARLRQYWTNWNHYKFEVGAPVYVPSGTEDEAQYYREMTEGIADEPFLDPVPEGVQTMRERLARWRRWSARHPNSGVTFADFVEGRYNDEQPAVPAEAPDVPDFEQQPAEVVPPDVPAAAAAAAPAPVDEPPARARNRNFRVRLRQLARRMRAPDDPIPPPPTEAAAAAADPEDVAAPAPAPVAPEQEVPFVAPTPEQEAEADAAMPPAADVAEQPPAVFRLPPKRSRRYSGIRRDVLRQRGLNVAGSHAETQADDSFAEAPGPDFTNPEMGPAVYPAQHIRRRGVLARTISSSDLAAIQEVYSARFFRENAEAARPLNRPRPAEELDVLYEGTGVAEPLPEGDDEDDDFFDT